jgi:hypothetical protein
MGAIKQGFTLTHKKIVAPILANATAAPIQIKTIKTLH